MTEPPAPKRQLEFLGERLGWVIHLRDTENCTFREIGQELGVGLERARQLYQKALGKIEHHGRRHGDPLYGLSVRAANCL